MTASASEFTSVSLDALTAVARDPTAPHAARVAAARTLLEYDQALGRHAPARAPGPPDPAAMSAADLAAVAAVPDDDTADPFS